MARDDAQIKLYVPHELRERIKLVAEENGRSMNAEIQLTLEDAYPAPEHDLDTLFSDLQTMVLHWRSETWARVIWGTWSSFRKGETDTVIHKLGEPGNNYFVVIVFNDRGGLENVIRHNYILHDGGYDSIEEFMLTESEKEEYWRLMTVSTATDAERARLDQLQNKMSPALTLPKKAEKQLRTMLLNTFHADEVRDALDHWHSNP